MLCVPDQIKDNGYLNIADFIESQIVAGSLSHNEKLPDTARLMELFQVSRDTIQRSLTRLSKKGLVTRTPRVGTFVSARVFNRNIGLVLGKNPFFNPSTFYLSMLTEFNKMAIEYQLNPKTYFILDDNNTFQSMQDLENDLKTGQLNCLIPVFMSGVLGHWLEHWDDMPIIFPPNSNYREVTYQGIKHLVERGYRKIHTISTVATAHESHQLVVKLRKDEIDGMQMAVDELKPDFQIPSPVHCGNTEEEAYHHIKEIFQDRSNIPDAILINHDIMTRGVIMALLELGIRIPDDTAIITHFNKGYNLFTPVELTKIQFDPRDHVIETLEYVKQHTYNLPTGRQNVPNNVRPQVIQGAST